MKPFHPFAAAALAALLPLRPASAQDSLAITLRSCTYDAYVVSVPEDGPARNGVTVTWSMHGETLRTSPGLPDHGAVLTFAEVMTMEFRQVAEDAPLAFDLRREDDASGRTYRITLERGGKAGESRLAFPEGGPFKCPDPLVLDIVMPGYRHFCPIL
jgi:hypothetical protein